MNIARLLEFQKFDVRVPFLTNSAQELAYRRLNCHSDEVHCDSEPGALASPLYAIRFCNTRSYAHLLALVNEDGIVRLHDSRPRECGGRGQVESFLAHYNAIFDFAWAEDDLRLVTASGDHSAVLWDLRDGFGPPVPIVRMVGHEGSVKTIACKPSEPNIFASGGRDGSIIQWDIRSNPIRTSVSHEEQFKSVKVDKIIQLSHERNQAPNPRLSTYAQCVSSVVYQNDIALISSSSTDRCIKIWDARKTYTTSKGAPTPLHVIARESVSIYRAGYPSLAVSPCRLKLFALCTDGHVYCFNISTTYSSTPVATYQSLLKDSSFFSKINLSPDGMFLSSGSPLPTAQIWSVAKPGLPLVQLDGHEAEVTCADWCKHGQLKLASCADDGTYRVWTTHTHSMLESKDLSYSSSISQSKSISDVLTEKSDDKMMQKIPKNRYFACHCPALHRPKSRQGIKENTKRIFASPRKVEAALSSLPNYVLDGQSPHRPESLRSPLEPNRNSGDWLRKLIAATPPPSTSSGDTKSASSSKKNRKTPVRARRPSARGSLLKYFKQPSENDAKNKRHDDEPVALENVPKNVDIKVIAL